jgi:hypothetical protein
MSAMTDKLMFNAIQAKRNKHLFWTVIELAIADACVAPLKDSPSAKAKTAMRFITTNIDNYLIWLDVDAGNFRKRLIEAMYTEQTNKFSDMDKRAFRYNYKWWINNKDSLTAADWARIHEQEERHP